MNDIRVIIQFIKTIDDLTLDEANRVLNYLILYIEQKAMKENNEIYNLMNESGDEH